LPRRPLLRKVTDGIYYATGARTATVGANSPIIVTDTEADHRLGDHAAARALVADLKAITGKPVKCGIDSHHHYDHAFGNQVFGPTCR
jgi:cyclase